VVNIPRLTKSVVVPAGVWYLQEHQKRPGDSLRGGRGGRERAAEIDGICKRRLLR
jgi:hypothetical protein